MRVRLGYVAIAQKLPKVTSSSPVTFKTYNKLVSSEEKLNKLKRVTLSNLNDLKKIIKYNIENQIHFYRITSALVPLATHPEVENWDYRNIFKKDFEEIGHLLQMSNMRVDTHPDQFNVINSTRKEVVESTIRNLWFHVHLFQDLNYKNPRMVIHIGSGAGGKDKAIKRFIDNFREFPKEISSKLILENDDKTFTAREVLGICKELNAPMVLDIHHHNVKNEGEDITEMMPDILNTWNSTDLPPKFHFSTPKEGEMDRKHADFINPVDFVDFIEMLKAFNQDVDIMLEAKKKDLALYDLKINIKKLKPEYKWIDKTTFEV